MDDQADVETHESVHLAHPLAVASGEVVVDGDDMHAVAGNGIEVRRHDRNEGLAFAGLHLGDAALMQDDAADELDAERLHAEDTPRGLAHRGECLGQHGVEILAVIIAVPELGGFCAQLGVGKRLHLRLERLYLIDDRVYFFKLMIGVAAEKFTEETHIIAFRM